MMRASTVLGWIAATLLFECNFVRRKPHAD